MQYKDFIIKIESKLGDDYIISIESPAGEGSSKLRLPFNLEEAPDLLQQLAGTFRGSSSALAEADNTEVTREMSLSIESSAHSSELPKTLFDSLFTGATKTLFDQSIGMSSGDDSGLRIKLQIDPSNADVAALASLPWELLYREDTRDFLNLSRNTPLVRYLNVQRPSAPQAFNPPLRILVVMASPEGVAPLNLEQERQLIEQSWAQQSGVEVDFLERPTTVQRLSDKLSDKQYHVLHYMGHGDFDRNTGQGVLLLEDQNGGPLPLDGQTLGGVILHDVKSLRLVFLNACDTAKVTKLKGQDPFAGVATAMIMAGIPAVVAMQFPITDKAAVSFAGTFYPRIVAGYPVDAAVAEGRKAIKLADASSMEWATPVLFMRSPDGVLFDIQSTQATEAPLPTPSDNPSANPNVDKVSKLSSSAPVTHKKPAISNAAKGAIGVILLVVVVIAAIILMPNEKTVPKITSDRAYTIEQARAQLVDSQLLAADDVVFEPSTLANGIVIRTEPQAGTPVDIGSKITLVASNGTVMIDDLLGKSQDEIIEYFDELPVNIEKIEGLVSDLPEGQFVRSEPSTNAIYTHDTNFTIFVAKTGVTVPDLANASKQQATEMLSSLGLRDEIIYELNFDVEVGSVIRTEPEAARSWLPNQAVKVYVSAKGGWVYFNERLALGQNVNDGGAKTIRTEDSTGGRALGTLQPNQDIIVLDATSRWALVQVVE